jgi:outer membrane biosynthesis protein TonB
MATKLPTNNAFEDFLLSPKGDKHIRLNISRNTLIAFVISILVHALILFFVVPKLKQEQESAPSILVVELAPPAQKEAVKPLPQEPMPEPLPEPLPEPSKPKKIITQKPSKTLKPSTFNVPDVLATPKPAPEKLPQPQAPANAPTDMASYIAQQRAKREAQEGVAARENAVAAAAEQGLTEEQKRDERIKNNLKSGTNGIFEIKHREAKSASFSFKGWTDYSNVKLQYYEVEASDGQDVRLVMIRRMIAIIREHYDGDFPWESQRLRRTITKSAKLEDSAELEDFLMQEFFGSNYKTAP